jgi:hypothetical protein
MTRTVLVDEENNHMGWIALRVLNLVASNSIVLPENLDTITIEDEIVQDICHWTLCSPEEVVDFFKKLHEHSTPFDTDADYAAYMTEIQLQNEFELANPMNFKNDHNGGEF